MKNVLKVVGFVSLASLGLMSLPAQALDCGPNEILVVRLDNTEVCVSQGIIPVLAVQVILGG